jgi:hypothetical protein
MTAGDEGRGDDKGRFVSQQSTPGLLAKVIAQAGPNRSAVARQIGMTAQGLDGLVDREERGRITLSGLARVAKSLGFELHYELKPTIVGSAPKLARAFGSVEYNAATQRSRSFEIQRKSLDEELRGQPRFQCAGLALVPRTMKVHHGDASVKMTPREMIILRRLLRADGEMVSIAELKATGWGDEPVSISSMRVLVHKLKAKLSSIGYIRPIVSQKHEYGLGAGGTTLAQSKD